MLKIRKEGILLEKTNLGFENQAVLNPACIRVGDETHLFYRAVRKDFQSSIGYCRMQGPKNIVERRKEPLIVPEHGYEKNGTGDPRIVFLEGTYYMFYTAFDGRNALGAYATSKDMFKWRKHGVITPRITYKEARELFGKSKLKDRYYLFEASYEHVMGKGILLWEKDVFMFPRKIKKKFALVHRILPDMQVIYFKDFSQLTNEYWKGHLTELSKYVMLESKYWYESRNIGGGCPPIETKEGWINIYHAVEDANNQKTYRAGAALHDLNDPTKVKSHLKEPLFEPEQKWELKGDVNNVVFPTGATVFDGRIYIYYGAADSRIGVASVDMDELLSEFDTRGEV